MNGRRRFDRPEYWTVIIPFLLLLLLDSSSCWSLNDQGLGLSKFRNGIFREALGALKDWNNLGGETHSRFLLGFDFTANNDASHVDSGDFTNRRLLQGAQAPRHPSPASRRRSSSSPFYRNSVSPSPSPSPSPSVLLVTPSPAPIPDVPVAVNHPVVVIPAAKQSRTPRAPIIGGILGGAFLLLISAIGFVLYSNNKAVTVKPWATGLSGQLQKAFVTGVPKLNRSEIVVACEDFSNIIGSVKEGTVYKGTLSSGVEIAVTSTAVKSRHDWSKASEEQFRKKIKKLSKVNHKNFVNLIGFCEEEQEPFTRVMVFEYAPNGTLFEHLHIKEAEHLDWETRLRIAMGMAYCLDHMHRLSPPIALTGLHSSSVYLTEDYAAKLSDFRSWNEVTAAKMDSVHDPIPEEASPESNVYGFGAVLFEMITGRTAPENLEGELCLRCPREMVDPTLMSFDGEALEKLFGVIKDCLKADPKERPTMAVVAARMKEITSVTPDGAVPKLSPLWWAELEITSTDLS